MAAKPKNAPTNHELVRGLPDILQESDRGFALIMAAWIDDALGEVIRAGFIDQRKSADELLIGDSPLATFSSRIKIAYCLAWIDDNVKHDLNIVRVIRNEFAHDRSDLSFESAVVRSRCDSMQLLHEVMSIREGTTVTLARSKFMLVSSHLLGILIDLADKINRPKYDPLKVRNSYFEDRRSHRPIVDKLVAYAKSANKGAQGKPPSKPHG